MTVSRDRRRTADSGRRASRRATWETTGRALRPSQRRTRRAPRAAHPDEDHRGGRHQRLSARSRDGQSRRSSTFSDGRAITARSPTNTTGRCITSGCASSTSITCSRVCTSDFGMPERLELVVVGAHERLRARRGSRRGCARAWRGRAACRGSAPRRVDAPLLEDLERAARLRARLVVEHLTRVPCTAAASKRRYSVRDDVDGAERAQVRRRPLHVEQARRRRGAAARPSPSTRPSTRRSPGGTSTRPRTTGRCAGRTARRRARRPATPPRCAPNPARAAACTRPRTTRRSSRADGPGRAHAAHHRLERGVDPHLEARDRAPQRPAHVEAVERDHPAGIGRPPRERPPARHREQPAPVRVEHGARLEVAAHRDDLVGPAAASAAGKSHGARRRLDGHRPSCLR